MATEKDMDAPRKWPLTAGFAFVSVFVSVGSTQAHEVATKDGVSVDQLGARVATLRIEMESISQELADLRQEREQVQRTAAARKRDLELDLAREKRARDDLEQALEVQRATSRAQDAHAGQLLPMLLGICADLAKQVREGFPLKREEREGAVKAIQQALASGDLRVPQALNRLWGYVEDELRLSKQNAIQQQAIALAGEGDDNVVLAQIAHLGTSALFFKTPRNAVGHAVFSGGSWRFLRLEQPDQRDAILTLFAALTKQIRTGAFVLPVAMPPGEKG